jgi:integrase/recombinase XerD
MEGENMLLSEAWELYKEDKEFLGYSPHTLKSYGLYHKLFIERYGDKEVDQVTYLELKQYTHELAKRLKPASVIARIRHLKSFFRWAHDEGLVTKNEAAKLKEPKKPKASPKPLTLYEIENMRDACETPLERCLFEFMYATGCRVGEIVRVKIDDIDWEKRIVPVFGKGSKERLAYFDLKCEIWLKKYLESRSDSLPNLFVTQRRYQENNGQPRPMTISQVRWIIKRIARRAGIEKSVYPHNLRHSFAMNMLQTGAPIEAIQNFLGHSDAKYTEVYAQLTTEMKKNIYDKYHS